MTREEKSNLLNELLDYEENNDIGNLTRAERGEFQQWVKSLEQEPTNKDLTCAYAKGVYDTREETATILDKIRAEIEKGYCEVNNDYDHGRNYGLYMATQIIDKYKAESER